LSAVIWRLARVPRLKPTTPVVLCALSAFSAHALGLLFPQQTPFISAVASVFLLLFMMVAGLLIGTQISLHLLPAQSPEVLEPLPASCV
jgi:membrane protein YdbS with pleckstrin-like domain